MGKGNWTWPIFLYINPFVSHEMKTHQLASTYFVHTFSSKSIMEKSSATQSAAQATVLDADEVLFSYEHVAGLEVPPVTWWKHPGLRRLYIMMPILFLGSTVNGYDGSLLNGLQTMVPWQECKRSSN
jgi:hypothetical protein